MAIAPAVFDRYERDVDLGYNEADRAIAYGFLPKLDIPAMLLDVAACKADVAQYGKVGITGFCLGGSIAWLGATRLGFDAAVGFYGGMIGKFAGEKAKCPVILHFGGLDAHIPASVGEAAKAANPEIDVYTYPQADHAFMRVGNAAYEPASADLAWSRTVLFFAKHIG